MKRMMYPVPRAGAGDDDDSNGGGPAACRSGGIGLMKRVWMRLVALAACAVLLMTMTPAVRAESTTLEVDFRGLTALAGGEWRARCKT